MSVEEAEEVSKDYDNSGKIFRNFLHIVYNNETKGKAEEIKDWSMMEWALD